MCVNLRSHHVLRRHEVFSLSPTAATIIITITEIAKGMRGGLAHYGLRNVTFSLDVGVPSWVPKNVLSYVITHRLIFPKLLYKRRNKKHIFYEVNNNIP